jgi:hypothetical protein
MSKYYVVSERYALTNRDSCEYIDSDRVYINRAPSNCVNGIINDQGHWLTRAHGEYDSYTDARRAVKTLFGPVHLVDWELNREESIKRIEADTVTTFAIGEFAPVDTDCAEALIGEWMERDVTADTSDKQINDLVESYEADAHDMAATIRWCARDIIVNYREELVDSEYQAG